MTELTTKALKRSRTKSEAIQDISSSSINEFVERILKEEFKVFDEIDEDHNGTLERAEIEHLAERAGKPLSKQDLDVAMVELIVDLSV